MSAREDFVSDARAVDLLSAFSAAGGSLSTLRRGRTEYAGPCPACGGTDRFSLNERKGVFNCRGSEGGDALKLVQHVAGCDFLTACEIVLGRDRPGLGDDERKQRDEDRRTAAIECERRRREVEADEAARAASENDFRAKERAKAIGKWLNASVNGFHENYLRLRLGMGAFGLLPALRTIPSEAYWHGQDDRKNPIMLFEAPAMVAPFVDRFGQIVGCHLTWIDLKRGPKFRPFIPDPEAPEKEPLPSKKMRGTKKGGLIPVHGFSFDGTRWALKGGRTRLVVGEGIETVLAVALTERFPADTAYVAAGDLGNLSGPADPASRFAHPTLKKADRNGFLRPVFVKGPVPVADQGPDDAMPIPAAIRDVLLLADGDSEPYATAAAMTRAEARISALDVRVSTAWPPNGCDFASMLAGEVVG